MAPIVAVHSNVAAKLKRPLPPGIQSGADGLPASKSSPSPSISSRKPPANGSRQSSNPPSLNGTTAPPVRHPSISKPRKEHSMQSLGQDGTELQPAMLAVQQHQSYSTTMDELLIATYSDNPSLVVHLFPAQQHLRFDQQEGVFTFKSPVGMQLLRSFKTRTIPNELLPLIAKEGVPFYHGCLVVQINYQSPGDSEQTSQPTTGASKTVPGSIHNASPYNVPSPYVPYPQENLSVAGGTSKGKGSPLKEKTSEQKDKEAMPAPSAPPDGQNNMKASSTMRQSTIVLHPTAQTIQTDLALMAMAPLGVSDAVQDGVPPTPGAIPPTPTANSMPPPAKKQKREHAAPDGTNIYAVEGQILLAHYPQLDLEPARTVHDVITKLAAHAHPAHMEAPPQPKTRKRTVAEVAADEAQQAERERFMLTCDERLASRVPGAQGAANSGDGDGQGGAAWEPRYDNFQVIAELKQKAKEKAEREARENDEKTKKMEQDRAKAAELAQLQAQKRATEAGRQRQEEEIRARQKHVAAMQAKKLAQQQAQQQVQLQAQQQAQEQSQTQAQLQAQVRAQAQAHAQAQQNNSMNHGIPMQNAGMPTTLPNGMPMPATMAGQVQARFHQVSQAQASSPIVRQNSPQNMSSPMVGNVAMQHSTSSMGGSPPRPSSVVQNHQPMSVPMTASMSARGSQQSHQAGTPRMPTATPNMAHSTPISRAQAMQTPRMTQASPPPGMMTPGQLGQAHLMMNAQGMNPQMQNQQFIAAQMAQQQQRALQQQQQQQQQHNLAQALQQGFAPGQPNQSMTPQQLAQQQRLMQQQQALMQQRGLGAQQLTPQQYAQLQAMQNNAQLQQQLHGGQMQNPMQRQMAVNGQGMVNLNPANHAQMAMIRQMEQIRQQQALQIQQQQQQQAQQQQQHVQQQMGQQPQMQPAASQAIQAQIKAQQVKLYQTHIHQLIAQHGSKDAIPPQVHDAFTSKCFVSARNQVLQHLGNQNRMSQIAMMQQQQQRQQQAQAQVQGMQGMMPQDGM